MKKTVKQINKSNEQENHLSADYKLVNASKKNKLFNTFDYIFLSIATLTLLTYLASYSENVSWQLSSIGRILMIKILPYYDWRHLKNKNCLLNPLFKQSDAEVSLLNCNVCEDTIEIDVYEFLEEDILEERYINLDKPVILTTGLENWPKNSNFINEIEKDNTSKAYPCNLSTNMYKGNSDLRTVLSKIKYFDQFFIHYQNCDVESMRVLRKYNFRPDVLPLIYSPTLYNWLIWNKKYNVTNYKQIELVEKVTVLGQLFGSIHIRLVPRKNCENVCPFLNIVLQEGEMLIFTSLWDLEYKPVETSENMAVIMEYRD